jgi:hypothetical protein
LLAERLGSKSVSYKPPKGGYTFDLVALCDSLTETTCLSLRDPILSFQSEQYQVFSKALETLKFDISPHWSSREVELLFKALLKTGATIQDSRVTALIETGLLSSWQVPSLVNEALKIESRDYLNLILTHVQDLRETDLTKILILCLSSEQEVPLQMLLNVFKRPFSRIRMVRCLKNFGTVQVEVLFSFLLGLLDSEHESLAYQWISTVIDAHYTIMLLQPVFLPLLKQLHEHIGQALQINEIAESSAGLIHSLIVSTPSSRTTNSTRAVITNDYIVDRSIDL